MTEERVHKYVELWKEAEKGSAHMPPHSIYQIITSEYNQMGKSNAALYVSSRVLEELHGWKLDLDNVVWDVPTFIDRRKTVRRWDIVIPDEIQRNAGNRSWQTEDNAIVGEEMETGSFKHRHVVMTIPSKHRLDKLIADVCTSQVVVNRTDVHHQISHVSVYSIARGQLDRNARERTPCLMRMTIGKVADDLWAEYLKRKTVYFDKRQAVNYEAAKVILNEANTPRSTLDDSAIADVLLKEMPPDAMKGSDFSPTKARIWLSNNGYGSIPYNRVQQGAAKATQKLREQMGLNGALEKAEAAIS